MMKITVEYPPSAKGERFIEPYLIINYTVTVGGTMIQLTDGKILKIKESYSYVDNFVTQANMEAARYGRIN
ncbi:hypothetical protein CIRMBP1196_02407 [Enterococcus cecorum]|nr:hypothetical protein CIRMBP1196_02407 [Enterococcus cecorum]